LTDDTRRTIHQILNEHEAVIASINEANDGITLLRQQNGDDV